MTWPQYLPQYTISQGGGDCVRECVRAGQLQTPSVGQISIRWGCRRQAGRLGAARNSQNHNEACAESYAAGGAGPLDAVELVHLRHGGVRMGFKGGWMEKGDCRRVGGSVVGRKVV